MGSSQYCVCCHRNRHLIVSLLFLLISSLTQVRFVAEGRAISKLVEAAPVRIIYIQSHHALPYFFLTKHYFQNSGTQNFKFYAQKGMEEEKMVVMTSMIGSRPPKCERMCSSCRNCEPVQVPVTTRAVGHRASHFSAIAYSKGDDISNYKPISWKCKCGNLIFNP